MCEYDLRLDCKTFESFAKKEMTYNFLGDKKRDRGLNERALSPFPDLRQEIAATMRKCKFDPSANPAAKMWVKIDDGAVGWSDKTTSEDETSRLR